MQAFGEMGKIIVVLVFLSTFLIILSIIREWKLALILTAIGALLTGLTILLLLIFS